MLFDPPVELFSLSASFYSDEPLVDGVNEVPFTHRHTDLQGIWVSLSFCSASFTYACLQCHCHPCYLLSLHSFPPPILSHFYFQPHSLSLFCSLSTPPSNFRSSNSNLIFTMTTTHQQNKYGKILFIARHEFNFEHFKLKQLCL